MVIPASTLELGTVRSSSLERRRFPEVRTALLLGALCCFGAGCLSSEQIARIEGTPGQEGTGVFLSRLPEVIKIMATYEATELQRTVASRQAQQVLARIRQDLKSGDRLPNHIAVKTQPDERLQGKSAVMLWDTQTEEILGNKVYDVEETPRPGDVARWESYTATFYVAEMSGGG